MLGSAVMESGWDTVVVGMPDCLRELLFLKTYLRDYNGQPIRGAGSRTEVVDRVVTREEKERVGAREKKQLERSKWAYMFKLDGSVQLVRESSFKEDKGRQEDVIRELKAVQRWMEREQERLKGSRGGQSGMEDRVLRLCHLPEERGQGAGSTERADKDQVYGEDYRGTDSGSLGDR
jgi:hypothetical protein